MKNLNKVTKGLSYDDALEVISKKISRQGAAKETNLICFLGKVFTNYTQTQTSKKV